VEWAILNGVPDADVQRVLSIARRRTFGRREVVFHRGDPADTLHLVLSGRYGVQIVTPYGDAVILSLIGPGDTFGELALLGDPAPRSATVFAVEGGETRSIHKLDFDALRAKHAAIGDILVQALAMRLRESNERLVEAFYLPAETRVLRRVAEMGTTIPLTQEEIANLAGTSRATVNKVLRDAQERGELALRRGRIEVLEPETLARRSRR
jgi:CRP/FNR family cyclic AMP-dependent transcriptional regulator